MFDRLADGFPLELSVNFNWQIFAWLFVQFGGIRKKGSFWQQSIYFRIAVIYIVYNLLM